MNKLRDVCKTCLLPGLATLASAFAPAGPALAQLTVNPYVDERFEHDSNVFRAENAQTNFLNFGDATLADTDLRSVVGMDGTYLWSQQKLTATLEGRRFDYDHFTDLDHNEYLGDVAFDWKMTRLFDGLIEARQEQLMAPFALGNSTQLTIDVDRKISATLNMNIHTDWRVETGVYSHDLKSPLQSFPDFEERETGTHLAVLNRAVTNLSYGISLDHIAGVFENAPDVGDYNQTTADLTMKYTASALTSLNAAVGYTKRTQTDNVNSAGGVTGQFGYSRQLTGKTSITVQFTRALNSYLAAGGSEIDTGGSIGLNWQATYRLDVVVSGGYMHSQFIGQIIPGSDANGRVDNSPTGSLNVNYQILRRLRLKAYLNRQSRSSNIDIYNFSDTTAGIEVRYTWL
ncbi:MAG TPA: hypothetical protein VNV61_03080 [Steroidobacteraceae bacterium]|jgi:hypothetical protein|nr:hypothetical protein [Steroidobacteraceae bacterium]